MPQTIRVPFADVFAPHGLKVGELKDVTIVIISFHSKRYAEATFEKYVPVNGINLRTAKDLLGLDITLGFNDGGRSFTVGGDIIAAGAGKYKFKAPGDIQPAT